MMLLRRVAAFLAVVLACLSAHAAASETAVLPNVTITPSEVLDLWPGSPPGEKDPIGPERVLPNRPRPFDQIENVSVPTLAVFLPSPEKRTGTGVLVIPGGGLERLAIEHEGYEVAEWLNAHGLAAFLLKYRVPPRDPEQRWKVGVQDAQRAMSLMRARADDWHLDRESIGTIGFSSGGEINVRLSVLGEERQYAPVDAADRESMRPDFTIPIYGGGFADSRANTLREEITSRLGSGTPPMFIVHAFDDGALSSIILMNALKRANVASELHIFGTGAHGFGVRDTGLPVGRWRELCLSWLGWQGFLDAPPVRGYARDFLHARDGDAPALPRFSTVMPESDPAVAFAVQRRVVRSALHAGGEVVGYKGAFTTVPAQTAFAITGPMHGVLFKAGRLEASTSPSIKLAAGRPLLVETEIGYVIGNDIGTKLRVPRQALTTIEAVVPVIELPLNVAPLMGGTVNARDVVAANAGSHQFIVGAPFAPEAAADLDAIAVTLQRDGQTLHTGAGADAQGGQAQVLMALINQIIDQGHVIHRGDIVISGALGRAQPAEKGNYTATFGALGTITFTID